MCWNYLYLSQVLVEGKNEGRRAALIEAIRNSSVGNMGIFQPARGVRFLGRTDGRFDGFDTSQKPRLGTGLKLGAQKSTESIFGSWFT